MRFFKISSLILLVFLFSFALFSSSVLATGGNAQQAFGLPPYGMAYQSDAQGPKLYGTLSVDSYNTLYDPTPPTHLYANIKATLRLTKNNQIQVYYDDNYAEGDGNRVDLNNIAAIQTKLINDWKAQIIADFFGSGSGYASVVLKAAGDYVSYDDDTLTSSSSYTIMDVILSVK